jgi:hypothetical protein
VTNDAFFKELARSHTTASSAIEPLDGTARRRQRPPTQPSRRMRTALAPPPRLPAQQRKAHQHRSLRAAIAIGLAAMTVATPVLFGVARGGNAQSAPRIAAAHSTPPQKRSGPICHRAADCAERPRRRTTSRAQPRDRSHPSRSERRRAGTRPPAALRRRQRSSPQQQTARVRDTERPVASTATGPLPEAPPVVQPTPARARERAPAPEARVEPIASPPPPVTAEPACEFPPC